MKFLRHLIAVVLVVAVVVGAGMLWAHASGGAGIGHQEHVPPREVMLRMQQIKAGVIGGQSGDGVNLADAGDLIRTCEIEAALAAVVITVSAVWRRHRRMRRAAARA